MPRVLILGGTTEARELAQSLAADGVEVVTALAGRLAGDGAGRLLAGRLAGADGAGRLQAGECAGADGDGRGRTGRRVDDAAAADAGAGTTARGPGGALRIGGFGGAAGLAAALTAGRFDAVVDATHPFAARISAHAVDAAAATGVPLVRLQRPAWHAEPGDDWHRVATVAAAAALAGRLGERPLVTVGRQEIAPFAALATACVVRSIAAPDPPLPRRHTLVLARGPFRLADELALLRAEAIDVVVTKDSGGTATAPKLVAARELRLPVVLVDRPALPPAPTVATVADARAWLARTP